VVVAAVLLASRSNALFSILMLFFMLSASYVGYPVNENSKFTLYYIVLFLVVGGLEANAIVGKTGPITTIKGVITSGFVLTFVLALLITLFV
jgi:hypothetical protein